MCENDEPTIRKGVFMSFDKPVFAVNAETLNAIVTALGGVVFAITRQLSAEQRAALQVELARLAQARNAVGDTTAGTLLLDLASACEAART